MECVYKQAEHGTALRYGPCAELDHAQTPAISGGAACACIAATARTQLEAKSEMMVRQAETLEKNMELADIPGTALKVSRIAIGTWAISGRLWGGTDESE
jgi:hypothetical protein